MANLATSADIIDWALHTGGEPTDGTSDFDAQMPIYLNRAYRAMWMGGGEFVEGMNEPWLWLKKDPPGTLILEPVRDTGTVSVTNNSAAATLSATVSIDLGGWFFKVNNHSDVFRVSAHTAGSATLTLDSVYTGPTNTAASYKLFKLEYALAADLLRIIAPMRIQAENRVEVDGVALLSLERDYPLTHIESGAPDRFAMVTETKARFNRYGGVTPTELIRVEYDYLQKPATDLADNTVAPLVPLEHRQVLADAVLFYLLLAKSDARVTAIAQQVAAGFRAMQSDNRARMVHMSRRIGLISPRPQNPQRYGQVLRTSSGLIIG